MAKKKVPELIQILEPEALTPKTSTEYHQRGWLFYSKKKYDLAEKDFQLVLETEPENLEALYGLALSCKEAGNSAQSLEFFEKALAIINQGEANQRKHILVRLIHGHVNQIKTGDWNLEKEVWQSVH